MASLDQFISKLRTFITAFLICVLVLEIFGRIFFANFGPEFLRKRENGYVKAYLHKICNFKDPYVIQRQGLHYGPVRIGTSPPAFLRLRI